MNKKLVVIGFLVLGFVGLLKAEPKPRQSGVAQADPQLFNSEAVYYSSANNVAGSFAVSTRSGFLYSVQIVSAAVLNIINASSNSINTSTASMEIFDGRVAPTGSMRRISWQIDATKTMQWFFNIGFSSGLTILNSGLPASTYNAIYLER